MDERVKTAYGSRYETEARFIRMIVAENMAASSSYNLSSIANASFDKKQIILTLCKAAASEISLNPQAKLAFLVPRKSGSMAQWVFMESTKNKIKRAYESGIVTSIYADVVLEGEKFSNICGVIHHEVDLDLREKDPEYKTVKAAYAKAQLANGQTTYEYLTRDGLNKRITTNLGKENPMSQKWKKEFYVKYVVSALLKMMPSASFAEEDFEDDATLAPATEVPTQTHTVEPQITEQEDESIEDSF